MSVKKPRLLMLTHRFPYPANRGDRIRSYNLLREMTKEFHVTLGALIDEPMTDAELKHVEALCDQVVVDRVGKLSRLCHATKSVLSRKSITEGMFASKKLSNQIVSIQRGNPFDSVLVFCSSMFPYVDRPEFKSTPIVVDVVDVDSCKWEQMSRESSFPKSFIFGREADRVRVLEQQIADAASAVTLVSSAEADLFRETVTVPPGQQIKGVSNGVDTSYFSQRVSGNCQLGNQEIRRDLKGSRESGDRLKLVFTGVMNYTPNVVGVDWFCRKVLPKLQSKINVELKIVGRFPNAQVQSLSALPGVEVVGSVPDIRPYLREADVAISPLKLARGIQNKILEAMAMSTPVVCTSQSAVGIDGKDGVHMIIANSVSDWCSALTTLALNQEQRATLASNARLLVLKEYSWSAKIKPLMNLLSAKTSDVAESSMKQAKSNSFANVPSFPINPPTNATSTKASKASIPNLPN